MVEPLESQYTIIADKAISEKVLMIMQLRIFSLFCISGLLSSTGALGNLISIPTEPFVSEVMLTVSLLVTKCALETWFYIY